MGYINVWFWEFLALTKNLVTVKLVCKKVMFPVVYSLTQTHFISLAPDKYIPFSDYIKNGAKVSTSTDKFCLLFHMHPIY